MDRKDFANFFSYERDSTLSGGRLSKKLIFSEFKRFS
jgi:hypothetical protein